MARTPWSPRRRWTAAGAVLTALASTLVWIGIAGGSPAAAAAASRLVSGQSGRCLTVAGGGLTAGAAVEIRDCTGGPAQTFTPTASGELRIGTNLCLDAFARGDVPGTALVAWACNGQTNQKFTLNGNGALVGADSGLCVDVMNRMTANGSPVALWTCNGQTNQRWSLRDVSGDTRAPTPPGALRLSGLTCTSVTLSWAASSDDVAVAYYDVYHDGQQMTSVRGTVLQANLTLVPGAQWGLYVNARDAAGNVSQASDTLDLDVPQCAVDRERPTTPTALSARAQGTSVTLTWTASRDNVGVRAYLVYRDGQQVGTVSGTASQAPATTFTDSGLSANRTYAYTVVARDAQANVSPASAAASVRVAASCSNPVCGVTQVGTDTDVPWGLATLPDGNVIYTRRDAHDVVQLNPATGAKRTLGTVPNVQSTNGEGGLLGLALSSTFSTDRWVYIMHTSPSDNRIVRIRLASNGTLDLGSEQILLSGLLRNKFHNGGRLRFGPDGKLYISTGDAQNGANSQNVNSLNGKILRINPDGSIPADNPFRNAVWSYGHRNPQGLAFDSQGRLWEQEFGNSVMDETNLIQRGGNYGWPNCEGTQSQSGGGCGTAGYIAPKRTYPTVDGSCSGIAIVRDVLYLACQRGTRVYREQISGSSLTNVTQLFVGTYGRLRTVEPAPGGNLWLTTTTIGDKDSVPNNSNERIFRVTLGS